MHRLHEQFKNQITIKREELDRQRLIQRFPELRNSAGGHFLSLRRYLDGRPEKFYDRPAYAAYLQWLQDRRSTDKKSLISYLEDNRLEIDQALLFLREVNQKDWHDDQLDHGDDYALIQSIDSLVHPTYLRLVEAVLSPFLRLVAFFSRLDRGKGTEGLNLWSIIDEIKSGASSSLVDCYDHLVRNAIAHGGIVFLNNEIRYQDRKGDHKTLLLRECVRLFDRLLDACNGIAAALRVFVVANKEDGFGLPRQILVEELQEETLSPWWRIEGCVESELPDKKQLVIYARPNSRHYPIIQLATVQSALLAEYFAPGYDRYFFSLKSPKSLPGFAPFNGARLRELRESGEEDLSKYSGILEDGVIFYVPNLKLPKFLRKVDVLYESLREAYPEARRAFRKEMGRCEVLCRSAAIHRNTWGAVLNGSVVLEDLSPEKIRDTILRNLNRICRSVRCEARRQNRVSIASYLPLGYASISVLNRDYRKRRIRGFGLGDNLVCTLTLKRINRIQAPVTLGASVENVGPWRIEWNKAWLESITELIEAAR